MVPLFPAGVALSFVWPSVFQPMRVGTEPPILNRAIPTGATWPLSLSRHPPQASALCEGLGHKPSADRQ